MPTIYSFFEWCEINDLESACLQCDGHGKLFSIRNNSSWKCGQCDGTGENSFTKDLYDRQSAKDISNWKKMTGKDLTE